MSAYLSTDRVFGNADDRSAFSSIHIGGPLAPGQTHPFPLDGNVFRVPLGSYYVILVADPGNIYAESNEDNNVVISQTPLVQVVPFSTGDTVLGTNGPDQIWIREHVPNDHSRLIRLRERAIHRPRAAGRAESRGD